jgi:hypothetical protein
MFAGDILGMIRLESMKCTARLIGLLVVFGACGDEDRFLLSEPEGLQPARLEYFGEPARVSAPGAAAVGESFLISIETYGGGCIEAGPTSVKLVGGRLEIRPLDDFPARDAVCTADIRLIDHSVTHRVDAAMTLEIAVHGIRVSDDGVEDLIVTRTVEVGGG